MITCWHIVPHIISVFVKIGIAEHAEHPMTVIGDETTFVCGFRFRIIHRLFSPFLKLGQG